MAVLDRTQTREAQIEAARQAGYDAEQQWPRAIEAYYEPSDKKIVIVFVDDSEFRFVPQRAQGLENASEADLTKIRLSPAGVGISWPDLDVDLSIPHLRQGVFGSKRWMAAMGAEGGKSTSEAKQAAARENGKKGGRPKS